MKETRKKAVALSYDEKKHFAPIVKAKGAGSVAEKIIQKAIESDVPIYEDPALGEMLNELDIEEVIPEELFKAVAEVFAFIYQLDRQIDK